MDKSIKNIGSKIRSHGYEFLIDNSCENFSNLCRVCEFLHAIAPHLFEDVTMLQPIFSYKNNQLRWDTRIKASINLFENQMSNNQITNINQIPLALFINLERTSASIGIAAHSFVVFIVPIANKPSMAFSMGLGLNEKKKIIIGSPDYNPFLPKHNTAKKSIMEENDLSNFACSYINKKPPGKLIIKAVEPLTFRYLKNFRDYLYNQIVDVEHDETHHFFNKNGNNQKYTAKETTLVTKMDYSTCSITGKNCAGFVEMLSHKKKFNKTSVSGKLGGIFSNPSNVSSRFFSFNGLNRFIGNVIDRNSGSALDWIINLYRYLYSETEVEPEILSTLGGSKKQKKTRKSRNIRKIRKTKKTKY